MCIPQNFDLFREIGGASYSAPKAEIAYIKERNNPRTDQLPTGPTLPDATDEALRKRRAGALLQAGAGMGRRSTMLTGTSGLGEPQLQRTMLGGY